MAVFPMVPLKHAIETRFTGVWGSDEGADEVDVPCVRIADFNRETKTAGEAIPTVRSLPEKVLSDKCLRTFDILLEKSGGGEKTPVGDAMLYVGAGDVVCANFIEVIRPKSDSDSRYLVYSLGSNYSSGSTRPFVRQTIGIQNLDLQRYFDQAIPLPDLDTQRRIADYLDAETAQIDTLTAELDGYVELLEKRRKVVITEAVTKRVPGAEVMAAFTAKRVHHFASVVSGGTPKNDDSLWDGDIPFITPPDLNGLDGKSVEDTRRSLTEKGVTSGSSLVESGVIFSCRAPVGHVGRVVEPSAFNQGCKVLVSHENDRFLAYALVAHRSLLSSLANGTTFMEVSSSAVANMKLPLPDLETQRRIADYLDKETARIDTLIKECRELKEILLKRRQVLITDVVTGKVEV